MDPPRAGATGGDNVAAEFAAVATEIERVFDSLGLLRADVALAA